jgi:hypothetical protein
MSTIFILQLLWKMLLHRIFNFIVILTKIQKSSITIITKHNDTLMHIYE